MAMTPWFVVTGVPLGKQIGILASVMPSFNTFTLAIMEPLLNVTIILFTLTPNCVAYKYFTVSIIFILLSSVSVDKSPSGIVNFALYSMYGSFISGTISLVISEIFTSISVSSDVNVLLLIIAAAAVDMAPLIASVYINVTDALP